MLGHLSIYRGLFASEIHIRSATEAVGMATANWSIGDVGITCSFFLRPCSSSGLQKCVACVAKRTTE